MISTGQRPLDESLVAIPQYLDDRVRSEIVLLFLGQYAFHTRLDLLLDRGRWVAGGTVGSWTSLATCERKRGKP